MFCKSSEPPFGNPEPILFRGHSCLINLHSVLAVSTDEYHAIVTLDLGDVIQLKIDLQDRQPLLNAIDRAFPKLTVHRAA
jgi:hypothetical protein